MYGMPTPETAAEAARTIRAVLDLANEGGPLADSHPQAVAAVRRLEGAALALEQLATGSKEPGRA